MCLSDAVQNEISVVVLPLRGHLISNYFSLSFSLNKDFSKALGHELPRSVQTNAFFPPIFWFTKKITTTNHLFDYRENILFLHLTQLRVN